MLARAAPWFAVLALAACAAAERAPVLPAAAATAADLSAQRLCIDNLLVDMGPQPLTLAVDDLADPARRFGGGSREALIAALSDMTQRSRSISIQGSARPADLPSQADGAPQWTLRGTLSAQDGAGSAAPAGTLALGMTLVAQRDQSVVPGSATRHSAALFPATAAGPAHAELRQFGMRFKVPTGGPDGLAPAQRALLELGAIEQVGRLARLPYWSCFGAAASDPKVAAEVQDWYDAMAARPAEIIAYFQHQLRLRQLYDGPVDGTVNAPLKEAVARYREVLGLSREPKLSLDFFQAYLSADHHALQVRRPAAPALPMAAPVAATRAPAAAPLPAEPAALQALGLRIVSSKDSARFARGEAVQLTIQPSRDAHVYCYHQDENRKITRFFPNRFQPDSRVSASGMRLPGSMRFEIVMNARGVPEEVSCFATEREVLDQLPAALGGEDFATLPVTTLEQVQNAFARLAGARLAQDSFQLRAR